MSQETGTPRGSNHTDRIGMAIAGVGGYGGALIEHIRQADGQLPVPMRVAAVYEPFPQRYAERIEALKREGVAICDSVRQLTEHTGVDAVWLPVPLHLHSRYTLEVLSLGRPVICEKPAASTVAEIDRMIAQRDATGKHVLVGFQEIYEPTTLRLKQLLGCGKLGAIREVRVVGCWPRSVTYFTRNDWAGHIRYNGSIVDDNPLSNAMAHFVNLALFFAGPTPETSATPVRVWAETYRANQIENYDTVSLRCELSTGPTLTAMLTFACHRAIEPKVCIICERGQVERMHDTIIIDGEGLPREQWTMKRRDRLPMLRCIASVLGGRPVKNHALATLEIAKAHTALVEAVSRAAPIRTVPDSHRRLDGDDDVPGWIIEGIEDASTETYRTGRMLSQVQAYPWAAVNPEASPVPPQRDLQPVILQPAIRPSPASTRTGVRDAGVNRSL